MNSFFQRSTFFFFFEIWKFLKLIFNCFICCHIFTVNYHQYYLLSFLLLSLFLFLLFSVLLILLLLCQYLFLKFTLWIFHMLLLFASIYPVIFWEITMEIKLHSLFVLSLPLYLVYDLFDISSVLIELLIWRSYANLFARYYFMWWWKILTFIYLFIYQRYVRLSFSKVLSQRK